MILKLNTNNLKKQRLLAGMTMVTLADKAGISSDYLFKIEKRERNPRPGTIKSLADALGVSVQDIAEVVGDGQGEGNTASSGRTGQQAATG